MRSSVNIFKYLKNTLFILIFIIGLNENEFSPNQINLDYRLPANCTIQLQLQNILGLSEKSEAFSPFYELIEELETSTITKALSIGAGVLVVSVFIIVYIVERYLFSFR